LVKITQNKPKESTPTSPERISITLPSMLYDETLEEAYRRKKARLKAASISGVIRDALDDYLDKP
jgi:metal-responsive CopG/Arc/MetJ family transcriptional regulator